MEINREISRETNAQKEISAEIVNRNPEISKEMERDRKQKERF